MADMIRISIIWAPNAGEYRIAAPRHAIGDRLRHAVGGRWREVVVERVDGPYIHEGYDRGDAFLYLVSWPEQGLRYAVAGKALKRRA